jgi:transposase-like protein
MAITKEVLDELLKDYKGPADITGPDGLLKQLTKALVERAMQAEMTEQLGYDKNAKGNKPSPNRRNGSSKKTLRSDQGPLEIEVPRDREGAFEPEIILIAAVDGLTGFPEAINAVFPKTEVQLCIVHMVRNSLKFVPYKDRKAIAADLKTILKFPEAIRKVIYTTNAIESVNYTIRKVSRNRQSFPTTDAAMKLVFMALQNISKKWTMPIRDWGSALNQFAIIYGSRVPL